MFQQELNGYNRSEVDSYIQRLKANYEAKLMSEKLKALESERKLLDAKNERVELEKKEKNTVDLLLKNNKQLRFVKAKMFFTLLPPQCPFQQHLKRHRPYFL